MLIKTILNKIEKFKSFIYEKVCIEKIKGKEAIIVSVLARRNGKGRCFHCNKPCPTYDKQGLRDYAFVPLWNIPVYFRYSPRRVNCPNDGIHVENVPWAEGKEPITKSYKLFLATWGKRLSWKEVATVFGVSWNAVYRSIAWVVNYGLAHRQWDTVEQIGIDEIAVFKGHKYLTLVYQLDKGCRRLLWCHEDRTIKTLLRFFIVFGKARCERLKFVCSDMWHPYLKVIKRKAVNALNILDRFHIMKKLNEAIDETRRKEVNALVADKKENVLVHGRWVLLKKVANLTEKQTVKLKTLLKLNLSSIKAYLMKEDFKRFWLYKSRAWADKFLEDWATRAMQSKLDPMKKVAKMLRSQSTYFELV